MKNGGVFHVFLRATVRIFRHCVTQAHAVAFNMFLAFVPMLVLVFAVLTSATVLRAGRQELLTRLHAILPPGIHEVVVDFLARRRPHTLRWATLGIGGTLFAGTQVIKVFIDGFQIIYGDKQRPSFWSREARALVILVATIVPWIVGILLTVFGKQLRGLLIHAFGLPTLFQGLWTVILLSGVLMIAMLVLAVMYRVGRPATRSWREVLPGAAVATLLWWGLNSAFGAYVRRVQYGSIYGGLAAAIGLLVWMQLNALAVFFGAAFNAEREAK